MKKILFSLLGVALTLGAFAQNPIDRIYSDFAANDDFTKITISGKMFEMANHIEVENIDNQEMVDAFSMIEGVSIVATDSIQNARSTFQSAVQRAGGSFENLMTIDDKKGKAEILINERNGVVKEVLIIAGGDDGFVIAALWGDIDLAKLATITRELQIDMMKDYDGEAAEAGRKVNMYPNPSASGQITVDIPSELKNAMVTVFDLTGKVVLERNANGSQFQFSSSDLSNGTYVVKVAKGNNIVFTEQLIIQK
ncbi:MAG: hypothetical protein ACJAU0_000773 [Flavobacteriales bacterium]|jgi:hypothetical protein